jgi:2-dehydro-3-deoxygalactonokinase
VLGAQGAPAGLAPLLFSARALVLANRLAASECMEYLSGLLTGDELRCGLVRDGRPAALVGGGALCGRYASALQLLGISDVQLIVDAANSGLWNTGYRAGLVRTLARAT